MNKSKQKYQNNSVSIVSSRQPLSSPIDLSLGGKFKIYIFWIDTVKRVLNVVLKIRYDLETLSQKQHYMDQIINDMNLKIQNNETRN